jgi:hypothetical protein
MINDNNNANFDGKDLVLFLRTIHCNSIQFELIRFWGWHPQVKLSSDTLSSIFDITGNRLKRELEVLIEKDILVEQHIKNGHTVYALSRNYRVQPYINKFAHLDWSKILNLKRQLFNKTTAAPGY